MRNRNPAVDRWLTSQIYRDPAVKTGFRSHYQSTIPPVSVDRWFLHPTIPAPLSTDYNRWLTSQIGDGGAPIRDG